MFSGGGSCNKRRYERRGGRIGLVVPPRRGCGVDARRRHAGAGGGRCPARRIVAGGGGVNNKRRAAEEGYVGEPDWSRRLNRSAQPSLMRFRGYANRRGVGWLLPWPLRQSHGGDAEDLRVDGTVATPKFRRRCSRRYVVPSPKSCWARPARGVAVARRRWIRRIGGRASVGAE